MSQEVRNEFQIQKELWAAPLKELYHEIEGNQINAFSGG